ncbi:MAG: sulfatase [Planctomycetota bacterium]
MDLIFDSIPNQKRERIMFQIRFICLAIGLACGSCFLNARASDSVLPNIVFIMADDCTFRDIGCYGGQAKTPNIDRLAMQGMKFRRCFQAAPMCSPTRHNIYTGLYPVKSGAYPNHTFVKDGTQSIVQYLKPRGYRLALSGKTHISPRSIFDFEYSGKKNPDMAEIENLFQQCQASETPFCLFACSNEPHSPWDQGDATQYPPEEVQLPPYFVDTPETRSDMSKYLAEITYFDDQVGKIVELLDKHDLTGNTMLEIVSEQGSSFAFGKWTCYETGLQSACIVKWPGKIEAGSESDAMIEYVDFLPTFLDAAHVERPEGLDGKSFLPVLTGARKQHKQYAFGIMTTRGIINGSDTYGIRSVRGQRFKYIRNLSPEIKFTNACTQSTCFESWVTKAENGDLAAKERVKRYHFRPAEELYDLQSDALEWNNLADDPAFSTIKNELSQRLDSWMAQQGDLGQATELAALERQGRNRKSKNKKSNKTRK